MAKARASATNASDAQRTPHAVAHSEFSPESVERELRTLYASWRRSAIVEAMVPMVFGLVIIPVVYLAVWGCLWLVMTRITHSRILLDGAFSPLPLGIGAAWVLIGFGVAWFHVLPLSTIEPPPGKAHDRFLDPPLVRIDRGEFQLSGPESFLQAESLLALFASGPRNILEGVTALRDMPTVDDVAFRQGAALLIQAAHEEGLTAQTFTRDEASARGMGILWRLKLIRKDGSFTERWRIRPTTLGDEIARA